MGKIFVKKEKQQELKEYFKKNKDKTEGWLPSVEDLFQYVRDNPDKYAYFVLHLLYENYQTTKDMSPEEWSVREELEEMAEDMFVFEGCESAAKEISSW